MYYHLLIIEDLILSTQTALFQTVPQFDLPHVHLNFYYQNV